MKHHQPKNNFLLLVPGLSLSLLAWLSFAESGKRVQYTSPQKHPFADSTGSDTTVKKYKPSRRPTYKPKDRYGDEYSNHVSKNPFYKKPSSVKTEVELDESMQYYRVNEKTGNTDYRPGTVMTYDEYKKFKQKETAKSFWKVKAKEQDEKVPNSSRALIPKIHVHPIFDRLFGGNFIDVKPNGSVLLDFGGQWQSTNNPAIPLRQQSQGGFKFDQQIQMNVVAKIGTKLKFTANQDTKSQFDFDNTIKLNYSSTEEDIIQKIDAGNVSMPINSSLITGAQNLFGVKTTMKFGHMTVTGVIANERGTQNSMQIQGGAQSRDFEIREDNYEDNRHYFLSQFYRDNYEKSLQTAPMITSGLNITRVEVWVTNRNNTTNVLRNIVALNDLGEYNHIYNTRVVNKGSAAYADNYLSNDLFTHIMADAKDTASSTSLRNANYAGVALQTVLGLQNGVDYELVRGARRLMDTEFRFHPQLGYISLNSPLSRDDVMGVSYEGTYFGVPFKVGEMSEDYQYLSNSNVIFLKLMRHSTIRTNMPTWNLQMKNIYGLNSVGISRDNFQLRVIYKDDITQIDNPSLHEGPPSVKDVPLLQLFSLDRLNMSNDPQPDGNFDFLDSYTNNIAPSTAQLSTNQQDPIQQGLNSINGGTSAQSTALSTNKITAITIDPAYGRVIFPVLEPFGQTLQDKIGPTFQDRYYTNPQTNITTDMYQKYVNTELYASTKSDALQLANLNKFFLKGKFQSTVSDEIQLQGLNIPPGSVKVLDNGIQLNENSDFSIDYNLGKVKILNQSLLLPGHTLSVQYEKSDLFQVRTKSFMGLRADYILNKDVAFGGTLLYMNERPLITRVSVGDEPANNVVMGLDGTYQSPSRLITHILDKLPLYSTKELSSVGLKGEVAALIPGVSSLVSKDGGTFFIDDFEGSQIPFNLGLQPSINWKLSSTPTNFAGPGYSTDSVRAFNFRRARMAWYTIDPLFYRGLGSGLPTNLTNDDLNNHYVRLIVPQNIFPNQNATQLQTNEPIFDLSFFPHERGSYNYRSYNIGPNGFFKDPIDSWGGVTRAITTDTDFDNANYQYIEFWMMDPFLPGTQGEVIDGTFNTNNTTGGKLMFNLGSISEDVIKDGLQEFEQGLPPTLGRPQPQFIQQTPWGYVTTQQYLTNAFSNVNNARSAQDIGLDGINSSQEQTFFTTYMNNVQKIPGITQQGLTYLTYDPSGDDFHYYLGSDYDAENKKILERYKYFNGMEGNSPDLSNSTSTFNPSSYSTPDNEDINFNNTLNDLDEYYEYEIDLKPGQLQVGKNFIVNKSAEIGQNGVNWYLFRIPIREGITRTVGSISGFKSIRYIRTYLTGWSQPVVIRTARMNLSANQWRPYTSYNDLNLQGGGEPIEPNDDVFSISTVSIEQNSNDQSGATSPYVVPPGFIRDRNNTSTVNTLLNEQSLKLCVDGLVPEAGRAAYKNISNLNLINYKQVKMFVHAETTDPHTKRDGSLDVFVRIGTDFTNNYYEIQIPLHYTQNLSSTDPYDVWRVENWLEVTLTDLSNLKLKRNQAGVPQYQRYTDGVSYPQSNANGITGYATYYITGNPDYSSVQTIMIGIRNPAGNNGQTQTACIWVDELRVAGINNSAGYAATGKSNIKLADLGTLSATANYTGAGYGGLEQKISQRLQQSTLQYGVSANLSLDKLLPKRAGIRLPLFVSYGGKIITPKYDPLNPDVLVDKSVDAQPEQFQSQYRDLIRDITTQRSIAFNNISKVKTRPGAKKYIFDIENFNLSLSYSDSKQHNISLDNTQENYKISLGYSYSPKPVVLEPFKNVHFMKKPMFRLLGDLNLSLLPNSFAVRGDLTRTSTVIQYYNRVDSGQRITDGIIPTYQKQMLFNRSYAMAWNFTKSLQFNYVATVAAIIDEPPGAINDDPVAPGGISKKDSLLKNLKNGGRIKNLNQQFSFNYHLPIDKIPAISWIQADTRYSAGYTWNAGTVGIADTLGNTAQNNRERSVNARFDLLKLYNKSQFLQKVNNPTPKPPKERKPPPDPRKKINPRRNIKADTLSKRQPKSDSVKKPPELRMLKYALRSLMSLRSVNSTYSISEGTTLPGYLGKPKYFGLNESDGTLSTDFLPFVLGSQEQIYKNQSFAEKYMSRSQVISNFVAQNQTENLTGTATLEPIKDFRVQMNAKITNTTMYQELFRYDDTTGKFKSLAPTRSGTFSISFMSISTAFAPGNNGVNSEVFNNFVSDRKEILERLTALNPAARDGTGRYDTSSQDVLIPSFIAAYSGQSASKVNLSTFPRIPMPNWRIDYAGLSKLPAVKRYFSSVTLSHSYTSNYNVGGYTSSLSYSGPEVQQGHSIFNSLIHKTPDPLASVRDSSGILAPINVVNNVSISESFAPLLGVNVKTHSNLSLRLEYTLQRNVSLNVTNSQITEMGSNGITVGAGYTKKNLKLPFKSQGRDIILKNDVTFRVDVTRRESITIQRIINQQNSPTAGQVNFQIRPNVSYQASQKLNVQFYIDYSINIPKVSNSFTRSVTSFGIQLRYSLS